MEAIFIKVINMSITASWLILAVVLLRFLLIKAPKSIRCLLWGLVALRLICPFTIESFYSLIPSNETISLKALVEQGNSIQADIPIANLPADINIETDVNRTEQDSFSKFQKENVGSGDVQIVESEGADSKGSGEAGGLLVRVLLYVWLIGMAAMLIYTWISYVRLKQNVNVSVPYEKDVHKATEVYLCDYIDTPFILGMIRPRIYLPSSLEPAQVSSVIAHEEAHLKRHDHWWKPLGFLLLTVYWFNPLIWVAYILLCRDIELACDERVIRNMSGEEKRLYSEALLSCGTTRQSVAACPLAFGEVGVKERIRGILNYKKPAFWVVAFAVVACTLAGVFFLTDPREAPEEIKYPLSQEDTEAIVFEWNRQWDLEAYTEPNTSIWGDYMGFVVSNSEEDRVDCEIYWEETDSPTCLQANFIPLRTMNDVPEYAGLDLEEYEMFGELFGRFFVREEIVLAVWQDVIEYLKSPVDCEGNRIIWTDSRDELDIKVWLERADKTSPWILTNACFMSSEWNTWNVQYNLDLIRDGLLSFDAVEELELQFGVFGDIPDRGVITGSLIDFTYHTEYPKDITGRVEPKLDAGKDGYIKGILKGKEGSREVWVYPGIEESEEEQKWVVDRTLGEDGLLIYVTAHDTAGKANGTDGITVPNYTDSDNPFSNTADSNLVDTLFAEIDDLLEEILADVGEDGLAMAIEQSATSTQKYEKLINYDELMIHYCVTEFLQGNRTDRKALLMSMIGSRILLNWGIGSDITGYNETGQEWFDSITGYVEQLQQQNSDEALIPGLKKFLEILEAPGDIPVSEIYMESDGLFPITRGEMRFILNEQKEPWELTDADIWDETHQVAMLEYRNQIHNSLDIHGTSDGRINGVIVNTYTVSMGSEEISQEAFDRMCLGLQDILEAFWGGQQDISGLWEEFLDYYEKPVNCEGNHIRYIASDDKLYLEVKMIREDTESPWRIERLQFLSLEYHQQYEQNIAHIWEDEFSQQFSVADLQSLVGKMDGLDGCVTGKLTDLRVQTEFPEGITLENYPALVSGKDGYIIGTLIDDNASYDVIVAPGLEESSDEQWWMFSVAPLEGEMLRGDYVIVLSHSLDA